MKIINHLLCHDDGTPYPFKDTPNKGAVMTPRYLIMHYTAGASAEQSVKWLTSSQAQASAHIVLGRDASITQLVPFNVVAWHAGVSSWKGLKGLNSYSIGIELDNAGPLQRNADQWVSWFGQKYPNEQVIEAIHKFEQTPRGWLLYTPEQIYTALELAQVLKETYKLEDILGHEDIAPGRKSDPGPAFPMETFRSRLFGRAELQTDQKFYETTVNLNIRSGPGPEYGIFQGSPLPVGTRLELIEERGSWMLVDVVGEVNGVMDLEGWVTSRYVRPVS